MLKDLLFPSIFCMWMMLYKVKASSSTCLVCDALKLFILVDESVLHALLIGTFLSARDFSESSIALWSTQTWHDLSYKLHSMSLCKNILFAWKSHCYFLCSGLLSKLFPLALRQCFILALSSLMSQQKKLFDIYINNHERRIRRPPKREQCIENRKEKMTIELEQITMFPGLCSY